MIFQAITLQLQTFHPLIIAVVHYGLPLILLYFLGKRRTISEKMKTECRELNDKLQKISQQLPGVVYQFRLNPDGSSCFPYASDAIKEIYRLTPQEVEHSADKVFAILHFEDFERVSSSILESAKNLTPWVQEYRVKFDDGTIRWLHGNALPQREADGSTLWHGFITDITEKKRIEVDYKSIVDASFNGFFSTDFSGKILSVSQSFCDMLGYSENELLNMHISDFEVIEKPEEISAHINRILHTGRDQFETKHRHKNGSILDVAISVTFLQTLGQRIFVFVNDITEQQQIQARLSESEFRWKFAIEGSGDGIWDWNISNDSVFFSKRWKEMIGFAEDELENNFEAWKSRIHPDDREKVFSTLHDYFSGKIEIYLVEHRLRCKDESYKWILARGMVVNRGENHQPIRMIGTHTDISAQKNLEEELRASEFRWKFAIEGSGDGLWDWDIPNGSVLFSKRWKEMLGFEEHEISNCLKEWEERVHPDDLKTVMTDVQNYFENKTPFYINEHRVLCKDGSYKWILDRGMTVNRDKNNKPIRMIGTHTDISAQKNLEEELRTSEFRLQAIIDLMPIAVFIKDKNSRVTLMNKACEMQWGVSFEQMKNKTGAEFYPPEQMEVFLAIDKQVFETQEVVEIEEYVLNPQTQENRLTHTYKKPVFTENGEPDYIIAISIDITKEKQQQEALKASEAYLRTIIDILPVPLALNDNEGNITFLNRTFTQTFGYELRDIPNLKIWWKKAYPDETYRTKIKNVWAKTLVTAHEEKTAALPIDVMITCKNSKQKTVSVSTVIISEKINLVALYDISERKKIEQELQRSNADLEQFAYAVSHDMRQPLRMVTSYLGLIETALQNQLDEETRTFLNFALDGAKRMDSMILSLLDYSRVGRKTQQAALISSRACLDEALAFLKLDLASVNANVEIVGDWVDFSGSYDEITRLLQNLIGNALKYHEENKSPTIKICASIQENNFRVEVHDNGIGIEPSQMERLFKVFSRLQPRSRFEGTGVGLALCRKIVEHHGGKIGVNSDGDGCGCMFWFELPLQVITEQELNVVQKRIEKDGSL